MFERFTNRARQVVVVAHEEARAARDSAIHADHLLLAMLRDPDCLAVRVMTDLGASSADLRAAVGRLRSGRRPGAFDESDAAALRVIGIDLDEVLRSVEENLGAGLGAPGDPDSPQRPGRARRMPFAPESKKALELALREAIALRHNYIGTEHLLLGLLRLDRGVAAAALAELGLRHRDVRAAVVEALRATG